MNECEALTEEEQTALDACGMTAAERDAAVSLRSTILNTGRDSHIDRGGQK